MTTNQTIRLGVDIGGTFTDVVLEHDGKFTSVKVLTTQDAPENAIIEGVDRVCRSANVPLTHIGQVVHGTWQQIVLCDFDNVPRGRKIVMTVSALA